MGKGDSLVYVCDFWHGFYVVQNGGINVHRLGSSRKVYVIHMFRAGENFAEATLTTDSGDPAVARALDPAQVLLMRKLSSSACSNASPTRRCGRGVQ